METHERVLFLISMLRHRHGIVLPDEAVLSIFESMWTFACFEEYNAGHAAWTTLLRGPGEKLIKEGVVDSYDKLSLIAEFIKSWHDRAVDFRRKGLREHRAFKEMERILREHREEENFTLAPSPTPGEEAVVALNFILRQRDFPTIGEPYRGSRVTIQHAREWLADKNCQRWVVFAGTPSVYIHGMSWKTYPRDVDPVVLGYALGISDSAAQLQFEDRHTKAYEWSSVPLGFQVAAIDKEAAYLEAKLISQE